MYSGNLKRLREERELTQRELSEMLDVKRATYGFWENGRIMIPLDKADFLSVYYKVRLSYILGVDNQIKKNLKIKSMDYNKLLANLNNLKSQFKYSYNEIANKISCNRSTCQRYFKGIYVLPIDRLILLSELFNIDIDKLCGKE